MRSVSARCLAPLLVLAVPSLLAAQAITPAPFQTGEITFAMRATKVNDFVGHVAVSRAEFHGDQLAHITGFVEVRLVDMHTGIGLRDTHMRNAMRADSFPVIRYELTGVQAGTAQGDTIPVVLDGHLTIHGVTRPVRANGTVVIHGATADVATSFPVDMREYGIKPPTRFFGAIRVQPETTIGVSLRFGN